MSWKPSIRNRSNIQFEQIRSVLDPKYENVHDELSEAYYDKTPFRTFGVLTKETFDKLHGLIFLLRDVDFHNTNLNLSPSEMIPEEEYNIVRDREGRIIEKKDETAAAKILELSAQGISLSI